MKVYALYTGCKYEGGGVKEIYSDKEKAIKFALMEVDQQNKMAIKLYEDEDEPCDFTFKEIQREEYWSPRLIKLWQNPVDEIIVYEYFVK